MVPKRPTAYRTLLYDDEMPDEVSVSVDMRIRWAEFERFFRPYFEKTRMPSSPAEVDGAPPDEPASE